MKKFLLIISLVSFCLLIACSNKEKEEDTADKENLVVDVTVEPTDEVMVIEDTIQPTERVDNSEIVDTVQTTEATTINKAEPKTTEESDARDYAVDVETSAPMRTSEPSVEVESAGSSNENHTDQETENIDGNNNEAIVSETENEDESNIIKSTENGIVLPADMWE